MENPSSAQYSLYSFSFQLQLSQIKVIRGHAFDKKKKSKKKTNNNKKKVK